MAVRSGFLEPGARDRDVRIDQRASSTDTAETSGYPTERSGWATLAACVPMARYDISARERFGNGQLAASYDTRWEMEYREDMDPELVDVPKMRQLVYLGRVHDIVAASLIGRREGIELTTLASTRVETT